tara:strand:+ start:1941 stop:2396 length:456 start_codon:yes stop_codon:yes gene_type:complete
MAGIRREIISSPVADDNEDIALGVNFPMNGRDGSAFDLTFFSIDAAIANVKNLLLTRKGERINHPQFGTNLRDYLFEPNFESLREKVGTEIRDAIELWLPYIVINALDVTVPKFGQTGLVDPTHGILAVLKISLVNNTIDEEEIVIEIKDI